MFPHTHHSIARLFNEAGLPAGVLNVIQSQREDAAVATETLIAHPHIRKTEFIGSANVGARIGALAGKYLKPVLMELGGKGAALVLDDADLELAANAAVRCGFIHHVQICFSTDRVIVDAKVYDQFMPLLKKAAESFPPASAVTPAGPARTLGLLQEAVAKGARVLCGEVKLLAPDTLQPVVITGVTPEMEIYDEEGFGPTLQVYVVNTDDEAIELVNSSKYGMTSAVYSKDVCRALRVARELDVELISINHPMATVGNDANHPGSLTKASGGGRIGFLHIQAVAIVDPTESMAGQAAAN
ncbi:Uu.00g095120.m01.CDS01 [Anthostomella pinea]|uniref:Uu.00g095120.m01.CDS01 n=1 Tax=Anthostomella pinea TaxID=933095 RepID=A0AAI8VU87_9PEZI|nr:Uu.00g095120.m01.CDS01 [Anthostomella pinea]